MTLRPFVRRGSLLFCLAVALSAGGCGKQTPTTVPDKDPYRYGSLLGGTGGINLFGGDKRDKGEEGAGAIGVNSFLWRAALDTVAFMPVTQVDPFGGVILTDWYSPPESQTERFKVNLYILDRQLRADAVKVSVFRQVMDKGNWRDAATDSETATKLEDAILTRARQLRIAQTS